jgi:hypothetical protein
MILILTRICGVLNTENSGLVWYTAAAGLRQHSYSSFQAPLGPTTILFCFTAQPAIQRILTGIHLFKYALYKTYRAAYELNYNLLPCGTIARCRPWPQQYSCNGSDPAALSFHTRIPWMHWSRSTLSAYLAFGAPILPRLETVIFLLACTSVVLRVLTTPVLLRSHFPIPGSWFSFIRSSISGSTALCWALASSSVS